MSAGFAAGFAATSRRADLADTDDFAGLVFRFATAIDLSRNASRAARHPITQIASTRKRLCGVFLPAMRKDMCMEDCMRAKILAAPAATARPAYAGHAIMGA
ncbi:MAG: hypothetical protein HY056_15945 [Proteobacteria bacterium]|nr:hypothetical protein [Pseudomonadota bacterium]